MEPIPEALAWARRADAWAQRPEDDQGGQPEQNRWSDVAATGRPAFPADGVGWRTETAEWRATEHTARWRQTTEWRSASGTHGWRSTTEAWQQYTGGEGFRPPVEPETRQQPAISGTAWPTAQGSGQPEALTHEPSGDNAQNGTLWYGSGQNGTAQSAPGRRFNDSAPPWQPASDARPAWQQYAATSAPWEQTTPSAWEQAAPSAPPWEQDAGRPARRPEPSWPQVEPTTGRESPSPEAPIWESTQRITPPTDRPTWKPPASEPGPTGTTFHGAMYGAPYGDTEPGTYPTAFDDGRHLVREDDRARWRREAAGQDDGPRPVGRRRAPETGGSRAAGGTGWSTRSDSDNWAGHTDTGSMQLFDESAAAEAPTWGTRSEAPDWRTTEEPAPDWRSRADSRRAEPDVATGYLGDETRRDSWRRSEGPEATGWQQDAPTSPGWHQQADHEASSWRQEDREPRGWRRDRGSDGETPGWQQDRGQDREPPRWQQSGSAAIGGRRDDGDGPGWQDTGSVAGNRRREAEPAEPWAQSAADTGFIPFTGQDPATDNGTWRPTTGAIGRARPTNPNRRRDDTGILPDDAGTRIGRRRADFDDDLGGSAAPVDPSVWRREPGSRTDGANWPADEPPDADWRRALPDGQGAPASEAVTEIRLRTDPRWQQAEREQAARGSAGYRENNTGDWRRGLAAENTDLVDGEPRRFGTQDFVPFRPVGSAAVPTSVPVIPPTASAPPREDLLVGSDTGSRRPDVANPLWPPRYQSPATTGSYERRAVGGGLATAPGRQNNLLEPDEDEFEEDTGGPLAAVGYTVIWYGVPVVLYVLYMLVLDRSQQAHALSSLASAAPQFGLSLVLSMVVAVGLRWTSGSWKAASVGLAAAVMGGGLATVLSSAITGNSLS